MLWNTNGFPPASGTRGIVVGKSCVDDVVVGDGEIVVLGPPTLTGVP